MDRRDGRCDVDDRGSHATGLENQAAVPATPPHQKGRERSPKPTAKREQVPAAVDGLQRAGAAGEIRERGFPLRRGVLVNSCSFYIPSSSDDQKVLKRVANSAQHLG